MSLVLFFFAFKKCFASNRNLRLLVYILLIVAILEALYGLMQALVPSLGVLWVDYIKSYLGDARGTYINRNHFAGFIEMILPLGLGYTLSLSNWHEKLSIKALMSTDRPNFQFFLTIGLAVMLLALVFSKSRAGITGWGLGFLTFVLLIHYGSKGLPKSYWVVIGIIIGMVTFYSLRIGVDPVLERFLRVSSDASRLDYWRDSLVIVKDHPFGTGLATFKQVFPVFNVSTVSDSTPYYAHNDYLQLLVETGWIGFVALVSGFYIFLIKSFRKVKLIKLQDDPFRFFMAIGALSGLVSIAFHSFFDFNLQMPANCVYFVMLLGIVDITLWQDRTLIDGKQN
jgi:O-antigen ligase